VNTILVKFVKPVQTGISPIMKQNTFILSLAVLCALGMAAFTVSRAAVEPAPPATTFQYATIECVGPAGGPVKVHVVRPDGKVEFFDDRLVPGKVPEGCTQPGQGRIRIRRHATLRRRHA
jgi:hypothetical protein